jgi:uncharacterized 2Fe-2S/4Fe-4S cluster protein (DUF4445 family)
LELGSGDIELEVEAAERRRTILVPPDLQADTIADLLRRYGLPLNTRCGGRGLCESCCVELCRGSLTRISSENRLEAHAAPHSVRACEHKLTGEGPVRLRIPTRALLAYEPQVVSDFRINVTRAHDPLPHEGSLGVAIDVGTTTVALFVVDLDSGDVLARAAGFNRQMDLGDDVLTRINLCLVEPGRLRELQQSVVAATIEPLLTQALAAAEAVTADVGVISVAGNTTMLHLLSGVDPSSMGTAPFSASFLAHRELEAASVGLGSVTAPLHLLPGAAAYVGADVCAGIFASGLAYEEGPCLLVDVGTNGEIIFRHEGRTSGCAAAAGPAFEGARLSSGMRAGDGAISHLRVSGRPAKFSWDAIGSGEISGICGSAYVEFLAEGRAAGLLTRTGRIDAAAPAALLEGSETGERGIRVATGCGKQPIRITEADLASLLQAKAAIAAGILTLLEREGVAPHQVKHLYLAGGFGMHLSPSHAIACGLMPGFDASQIQVVGNTALAGAYLALMDRHALEELGSIARSVEIVELNLDPGFEERYIENLLLPD